MQFYTCNKLKKYVTWYKIQVQCWTRNHAQGLLEKEKNKCYFFKYNLFIFVNKTITLSAFILYPCWVDCSEI